ncbi:MAG: Na+/H+ antiporter subunit D, partial [Rhodospirillaceae bacterium]|nr:Na+/H+ antiporter subunit D [Rhodospirillaceae bacterium]
FVFFGKDSGLRPPEPPLHMRAAMVFFAVLCVGIGLMPQTFYQLLPYQLDYEPNTPDHIVTQFQILLFSGAAFFLFLKYYGWHLVESLTLDLDWLYRVWGRKIAVTFTENSGSARDSIIDDLSKGARATIDAVHHRHGPDGILARTMPTGRMVFWAIVMLAVYLLVDFVFM